MNTPKNLKLVINHANAQYESGEITEEEYKRFKSETIGHMDTFLLCGRFTDAKYKELFDMFIKFEDEDLTQEEEESV